KVLQTKSNDASGQIYFDELAYEKAGEYHYTIREKTGSDRTISYDTTVYRVTVNVKKQADKWVTEVVQKEEIVFNNKVKAAKQITTILPGTNDKLLSGWIVLGVFVVIIAVGIYYTRRKRKQF
ncbi:Spy0128 family protein, partial [Enterococcus ratti]